VTVASRAALVGLAALAGVGLEAQPARDADRYPVAGMVLRVDAATRAFVASIEKIPGFMDAMAMPFEVKDARELTGLVPGAIVEFTLVVDKTASHAEGIRVRRYQSVEQDPQTARRLSLLKGISGSPPPRPVAIGEIVPDFTLTDQRSRRMSLSSLRGKVVAVNFIYTACQLPDFCARIVNHFAVLRQTFASELGRNLVLLTMTFDPARDQPEVLAKYASQWKAEPDTWRFLTGSAPEIRRVLDAFGVSAFPDDGLMDHSLHTALIDRDGRLVANIEGNQYTVNQLLDLTASVLTAKRP
jgi:protein SCO1/2